MRILGIDPGLAIVGYSILDVNTEKDSYELVSSGSIQTDKTKDDASRLNEISRDLQKIIKTFKPDEAGIEKLFFFKNQKTVIPVAQARGVILMVLSQNFIKAYEYTPIEVKQTLTGYGRAKKDEVAFSVAQIVTGRIPKLDDTVDSIAIAVCHARNKLCSPEQYAQN